MIRLPLLILLTATLALAGCRPSESPVRAAGDTYGEAVEAATALPIETVAAEASTYAGRTITVEGRVTEVCQKKGCWLALDAAGTPVRVMVARTDGGDYTFTVPTDVSGARAVVQGQLKAATLSPGTQRHLAEDAGESPTGEELAPQQELQIIASGVRIQPAPTG
jgi:hypothetical protein